MLLGSARKRLTLVTSRSNKEQETCETTSFRSATNVLSYWDEDFFIRPFTLTPLPKSSWSVSAQWPTDPARSSLISCRRRRVGGVDESRAGKVYILVTSFSAMSSDDDQRPKGRRRGRGGETHLLLLLLLHVFSSLRLSLLPEWARITGIVCAGRCGNAVRWFIAEVSHEEV